MQRAAYLLIMWLLASPCWAQPGTEPTAVGLAFQNGEGWTDVPYPPADGSKMIFIDADAADDTANGFMPWSLTIDDGVYDHTGNGSGERLLTETGAFSSYTHTGDDRTDVIYVTNVSGGIATGWYKIASKVSNDAVTLEAASGLTADGVCDSTSGPKKTLNAGLALMTDGASSDQLLLQRGDTWTDENLGLGSKSLNGSESAPVVLGAYGPLTDARPIVRPDDTTNQKAIQLASGTYNHVYILSIETNPNNRVATNTNAGITIGASATTSDILLEDCYAHDSSTNILIQGTGSYDIPRVTLRRNIVTESWTNNSTDSQGCFIKFCDGVLVEENIFDKNGWENSKTEQDSPRNHSIYLSDETKNCSVRYNISSQSSLNGFKVDLIDTTGWVYDNCIPNSRYAGQLGVGDEDGGAGTSTGNYLYIYNNTADGYHNGFHVTNVAGGYLRNNVMGPRGFLSGFPTTGDPYEKSQFCIKFVETEASPGVGFNNMVMDTNIIYDARGGINCSDLGEVTYGQWANVVFSNNDHVEPNTDKAWRNFDSGLDVTFTGNNYYSANTSSPANRFDVDSVKQTYAWWVSNYEADATNVNTSYTDPGRTVAEYATATTANGGLELANIDALYTLWRAERRGNWNTEYHAKTINDWIRAGYGLSEYNPTPDATAPEFVSAEFTGTTTLTVNFDEFVDASDETGFTLTASGGAVTLTMTTFSGSSLVFTTSRTVLSSETLTLSYDSGTGDVADAADNALGDLTSESVTNSGSESPPASGTFIPGLLIESSHYVPAECPLTLAA